MKKIWLFSLVCALSIAIGSAQPALDPAAVIVAEGISTRGKAGFLNSQPVGIDLDVTYISRTPLYHAYCVQYAWDVLNQPGIPALCPGTETDQRWPDPGQLVTFTAHIVNKGTQISPAFDYVWLIDDIQVASGTLPALAAAAQITTTYQWAWGHGLSADGQQALGEHRVSFHVDPVNAIAETHESNNQLQDFTRAMSFNLTFTPEMYLAYNQPVDPVYPYSAEDWLQKQIAAMNANFANAIYPVTPQGAALRVRINQINIAANPPDWDGKHDGGWFMADDVRCEGCGYYDAATDIDWGLVHELSHQVSLIDLYAIGVYASNVFVQGANGQPTNVGFGWDNAGLMGGGDISPYTDHNLYSSHTAGGAHTLAGFRNGYYGAYLFDIPENNYLQILDNQGNPASQVQVMIFQRTGPRDWTGQMGVDNLPEISGTTDSAGIFQLPNRSAQGGTITLNQHTLHDNPFGVVDIIGNQGLLLIQLSQPGHAEFHWLDITQFNLAYWMGDVISHTFTIHSHLPAPAAPLAPEITTVQIEGVRAMLDWLPSPSPGVTGYRVYRATPPQYQYQSASGVLSGTHFEEEFWGDDGQHRIYAVTALDGTGKESGFGELVYAPGLGDPVSVAVSPSGERVMLNQYNLYPLLSQHDGGRYWRRLINVHYDLWDTSYFNFDPTGRLILSGFGEFPGGRAAVRLYDEELRPVWAFGTQGTGPGQFSQPAGVAWWGPACPFAARPYPVDADTLLLVHFEGDATGMQGEPATASGISFEPGKFGQGVLLDVDDTLSYAAAGNLNHTYGALEFWLRPTWDGNDGGNHTLFWWGEGDNFFHLRKDPISNLVFDYFYTGGSCGVPLNVADWRAGEWHHLGLTWDANLIGLFVDGRLIEKVTCSGTSQPNSASFYLGSDAGGQNSIEAVIDEFRVLDALRVGIEEPCGRLLVVDRGHHRLQAFDVYGNLLSVYGSYGSGEGQFNTPAGIAVDRAGRVFVADAGNNRVVLLGFDGSYFSHLDVYTPGLDNPTGLAVDPYGYLYIADTNNDRIVLLDRAGELLAEFSEPNAGYAGSFSAPQGVAIALNGDILVADTGNQRVITIQRPGWLGIRIPLIIK